ncbi:MAG: M28 family metallopeptidase [Bacteroidales bacterium]
MKTRISQLIVLSMLSVSTLTAQQRVYESIAKIGQTDNRSMEYLDVLTNRFGGRPIGSDAYDNSGDWIISKFKEWNIPVRKELAGELPVGFNRGAWFGALLGKNGMNLHFVTPSYTSGTKGKQIGHVVFEPKTRREFDRMKKRLNGAWVLISGESRGWPVDFTSKGDSVRKSVIAYNEQVQLTNDSIRMANREHGTDTPMQEFRCEPALFYREMADAGILGIIQSANVPLAALYDRQVVHNPQMTFDKLPVIPDIKLDKAQYNQIAEMVKQREDFFLEFDIRNHFKMGPVPYHNIVGEIKGTTKPDEYVILSAHLDAFDVATGGVDDGSGVTPIMEAARMLAQSGAKPKRTILFCFFAGEEFGLVGAKAWAESNKDKLKGISNLINRDGGPTVPVGMAVPQSMQKEFNALAKEISKVNQDFPFEITVLTPGKRPKSMGGTDASVFAVQGIPTVSLRTADPKGYDFNYNEIWHTERDLYNKSIPEYQKHAATVMAMTALGIANMDTMFPRSEVYSD